MAFRPVEFTSVARFNSATSSELLFRYETLLASDILKSQSEQPSRRFAPSSFRCDRRSWFKLRGVEVDVSSSPDTVLDFAAEIGTACHRIIQSRLKRMLDGDWIDVADYLNSLPEPRLKYECTLSADGLETVVELQNPPVKFACDGLIRLDGQVHLLEIKSTEFSSWKQLTGPKLHHLDQVRCYATLLDVDDVLFMYIDRQYGGLKCYQYKVTDGDKQQVWDKMNLVMRCVDTNIAPEGLPKGDSWCTPSMCPYYIKCQEYGR